MIKGGKIMSTTKKEGITREDWTMNWRETQENQQGIPRENVWWDHKIAKKKSVNAHEDKGTRLEWDS